jgi:5-methyltetrahydropteroyltriglutamate--homocysteine methyltransferase
LNSSDGEPVTDQLTDASRFNVRGVRVEQVGSLVKPPSLTSAFRSYARGELSGSALEAALRAAVRSVVSEQERRGLPLVTDGEFGRWVPGTGEAAGPVRPSPVAEYLFVRALTPRPIKISVPSPDYVVHGGPQGREPSPGIAGEDLNPTVADTRRQIDALVDAGCRYVQVDLPSDSWLGSRHQLARIRGFGHDPLALLAWSTWASNDVVAGVSHRATTALHLCGADQLNRPGSALHDDRLSHRFFGGLSHHRLLVDCQRGLDFRWLRFVPTDKTVVLGLVSTRPGTDDTVDDVVRSVERACRYRAVEQLAIGPECGFSNASSASSHETVSVDDQWRKLETLLAAAGKIWGAAVTS